MPKKEIRPATKPDPAEVEERLERDRAAQANYDAQAERNAEALAQDPAQQEIYRREKEGVDLLDQPKRGEGAAANKRAETKTENKAREPELADSSPRRARTAPKSKASKKGKKA